MKVAVIGCGTIANAAHIPSYMKNPEVEIKYFCDIIPESRSRCSKIRLHQDGKEAALSHRHGDRDRGDDAVHL